MRCSSCCMEKLGGTLGSGDDGQLAQPGQWW